jgi:hypothetical protein
MEYLNIQRPGDAEEIRKYKKSFEEDTLESLIEDYNKQARLGIVGVHQQALYLIALKEEFEERLINCPIYLKDHILGMKGEIEMVDGEVRIVKSDNTNDKR